MKFKIYYENIEIDLPLARDERNTEEDLDMLNVYLRNLVENKKLLETFKLEFKHGS